MISHYPISKCHSSVRMIRLSLTTTLLFFILIGFFKYLNIFYSFLLVSLSKVTSLTLCLYCTIIFNSSQAI
ncbi:hypothetical protein DIY18_09390 [Streptococcus iniae]|nr:hypothetical protein DIY14_09410 [Streptococcus iniae]RLU30382.1 hypothetical protein DIY17_09275 [Streptococcus iniae]RLU30618.1 hypothetical protein DIY21_09080 [Streptococcus iniae]RLU34905.1 hypothetical protein DIY22_09200 [Streptococcus iniae]RLU35795.1 hypothetical protein DIY19_09200 [Streptococcus iniae]